MDYQKIIVDEPRPRLRRITLNRPDKRNPLSNALRGELFNALESADREDSVRVTIIRGAGSCFSLRLRPQVQRGQGSALPHRRRSRQLAAPMWWRASSRFGTWPSRSSPRCMATA